MPQTYLNQIVEPEVSIAVEQLLIAPSTVDWTPAKIADPVDTPPTGFCNLGAVVEDSVTLSVTREKYQLKTGAVKNLQYEAVMGIGGVLEASLIARRGTLAYYGLGTAQQQNLGSGLSATVASVTNRTTYTMTSTAAAGSYSPGDLVAAASTAAGNAFSANDAYVSSVTGATIVFSPAFPNTLSVGDVMQKKSGIRNPFGTTKIARFHLLGVADFIDGVQVVHQFRFAEATGDWTEQFRPDQEGRLPAKFEALGYVSQTYDSSASHVVVGERFWFR